MQFSCRAHTQSRLNIILSLSLSLFVYYTVCRSRRRNFNKQKARREVSSYSRKMRFCVELHCALSNGLREKYGQAICARRKFSPASPLLLPPAGIPLRRVSFPWVIAILGIVWPGRTCLYSFSKQEKPGYYGSPQTNAKSGRNVPLAYMTSGVFTIGKFHKKPGPTHFQS